MRYTRRIAVAGVIAGLCYAGCYQVRRAVRVPCSFAMEARFEALPPDDRPLAEWLKAQPGVFGSVGIGRLGDGRLLVLFRVSRNLLGEPPVPNLDAAALALGYTGGEPFRDYPRPPDGTPWVAGYD